MYYYLRDDFQSVLSGLREARRKDCRAETQLGVAAAIEAWGMDED